MTSMPMALASSSIPCPSVLKSPTMITSGSFFSASANYPAQQRPLFLAQCQVRPRKVHGHYDRIEAAAGHIGLLCRMLEAVRVGHVLQTDGGNGEDGVVLPVA